MTQKEVDHICFQCIFTRGCRVSTGKQVEELQAEVSVRTLVKQPTNNSCQTSNFLRSRCLIPSDASSAHPYPAGMETGAKHAGCDDDNRLLVVT